MRWPLRGRHNELRHIHRMVSEPAGALVLAGSPGVGKTRLAHEGLALARRAGRHAEWSVATSSARSIPFGALGHLLPVPASEHLDRSALLQRAGSALAALGGDGMPPLLMIDDAHLLDDASAVLVHQLAVHGDVGLLLTVRTDEPAPDPVTALWKDELASRIDVQPLGRPDVEALVEQAVGGPVTHRALDELWLISRGNALFLREVLQGAMEHGTLALGERAWELHGSLGPSSRLQELIDTRLAALAEPERAVVELLAVAEPLELELVERVLGPTAPGAIEPLRLVVHEQWQDHRTVRLAHPLYGDVMRGRIPPERRRELTRRLADALESIGTGGGVGVLRLATWRMESGDSADPKLLVEAAEHALTRADHWLAERLASAALAVEDRHRVRLALGKAIAWQGRWAEGDDHLARAEQLADSDGAFARAALARTHSMLVWGRRPQQAAELARRAFEAILDENWRDELQALSALIATFQGDLPTAVAAGRRVMAREDASDRAVRTTLSVAVFALVLSGGFAESDAWIARGLSLVDATDDEHFLAADLLCAYRAMQRAYAGNVADAVAEADAGFRAVRETRGERRDVSGPWGDVLCHLLILRGRVTTAARVGRETFEEVRERDPFVVRGMTAAGWAYAMAHAGDDDETSRLLGEVEAATLPGDPRPGIFADLARARLAGVRGDTRDGAAFAAQRGREAVAAGHLVWGAFLLHEAVRLGSARQVAADLAALEAQVEGDLLPILARHARALADADAAGLEWVSRAYERAGADLHAAEAAAQAGGVHRRVGSLPLAAQAAARSSMLLDRCEGAALPWLRPELAELTDREREVAVRAARGLTSRELAADLGVSVRTVDNHLAAVYRKLDLSGREDLAGLVASE